MQGIRKHLARREVFDVGKERGAEGESLERGKQGPMEPAPALFPAVWWEPVLISEAASLVCIIHRRFVFPWVVITWMCLAASPPHTSRCLCWFAVSRVEGAVVQQSMGHTESSRWGACSVDRLSDGWTYYLDTKETPRSWPGFSCTQMYLDLLEGTSTLQRISFHVPHTTHPPYLLPKLWWTSHVMRQSNEGGLKKVWGSKKLQGYAEGTEELSFLGNT